MKVNGEKTFRRSFRAATIVDRPRTPASDFRTSSLRHSVFNGMFYMYGALATIVSRQFSPA